LNIIQGRWRHNFGRVKKVNFSSLRLNLLIRMNNKWSLAISKSILFEKNHFFLRDHIIVQVESHFSRRWGTAQLFMVCHLSNDSHLSFNFFVFVVWLYLSFSHGRHHHENWLFLFWFDHFILKRSQSIILILFLICNFSLYWWNYTSYGCLSFFFRTLA